MSRTSLLSLQPLFLSSIIISSLAITGCNREPDISVQIVDGTHAKLLTEQFSDGVDFGFLEDNIDTNGEENTWESYEWVRLQTQSPDTDRITVVRPGQNTTYPHPGYWIAARSIDGTILGRTYQRLAFSNSEKSLTSVEIDNWCGDINNKGFSCTNDDNERTLCVPTNDDSLICTVSSCGDGVWDNSAGEDSEQCDPNDRDADDALPAGQACNDDCEIITPSCGDSTVHPPAEECDDGGESVSCNDDCTARICGDGKRNLTAGETCDDGNDINGDACTNACKIARCGDGVVYEGFEQCDDENDSDEDLCNTSCEWTECGDGIIQAALNEVCDDGNDSDNDNCTSKCQTNVCGDGFVNIAGGAEECDDGGFSANCNNNCTLAICGDGILNILAGEQCDDGGESATCNVDCTIAECGDDILNTLSGEACDPGTETESCNSNCTLAVCGDGIINVAALEQCDTGGETADCNDNCTISFCGDGRTNASDNEDCDDGNESNTDACTNTCETAQCGDGFILVGTEECDDANTVNTDACTNGCESAACGDGIVRTGFEDCDDANDDNTDTCNSSCTFTRCGDGIVQAVLNETCDDGNDSDLDNCKINCTENVCGDGYVNLQDNTEECDDNNSDEHDDCLSTCMLNKCGDGVRKQTSEPDLYNGTIPLPSIEDCDDANINANDGCNSCISQIWTPEILFADETSIDEAEFSYIEDIAFDLSGNMYVADTAKDVVYRVDAPTENSFAASKITVLAGGASSQGENIYESTYSTRGDGDLARYATLDNPKKIAIDGLGNIYILEATGSQKNYSPDEDNRVQYVRRISPEGDITTVISSAHSRIQPSDDSKGTIQDIAVDGTGQLYLLTSTLYDGSFEANHYLFTLEPDANPLELQNINIPSSGSGPIDPEFLAIRDNGTIYISQRYTGIIYKLSTQELAMGNLTPVIGSDDCFTDCSVSIGKPATDILLFEVTDIDISSDGKLRTSIRWLQEAEKAGVITFTETATDEWVVSEITSLGWEYEGSFPISTDPNNSLFASDDSNRGIIKQVPGTTESIVNSASESTCIQDRVDSLALESPRQIIFDSNGDYYVLDTYGYRIYKVNSATSKRYELVGTGSSCYFIDGFECGDNEWEGLIGFSDVTSIALGANDDLYIADVGNNRIRKITLSSSGQWESVCDAAGDGLQSETIIGMGESCSSSDCLTGQIGSNASFNYLRSIETDSNGNLYILDNNNIYRAINNGSGISSSTAIELVLGCEPGAMDCSTFNTNSNRVELNSPQAFAIGPNGDLWVADSSNYRIIKLASTGGTNFSTQIEVIAGDGSECSTGDCGNGGNAMSGSLGNIQTITPLTNGQVLFSESIYTSSGEGVNALTSSLGIIRALVPSGASWNLQAHAGTNTVESDGSIGDYGPAQSATFLNISDLRQVPDNAGLDAVWVAVDTQLKLIRAMVDDGDNTMVSVGGAVKWPGDCESGDPSCQPSFDRPTAVHPVEKNAESAYWVVDAEAGRIRQYQVTGADTYSVDTVLGYPGVGYLPCSGISCEAPENLLPQSIVSHRTLVDPAGIVQDSTTGAIYISEQQSSTDYLERSYGSTIHCIDEPFEGPLVYFFAGSANGNGYFNDVPLNSQFQSPAGMAIHNGYLYVADSGNHVVRRIRLDPTTPCVAATDEVETVAGVAVTRGYLNDDGVLATQAYLNSPEAVAINHLGDIYIADTNNNRVRRIAADTQEISTVAGHGTLLGAQLPGALYTDLQSPTGLLFDSFGNLFITSSTTIKMVTPGDDGVVTGQDTILTLFPRSPTNNDSDATRKLLTASKQKCLSAIALETTTSADDTLHALDGCNGSWLTLRRSDRP